MKHPKKSFLFLTILLAACFLIGGKALAQTTLVTLEGIVTDEEGTGLPGVTVNVRNVDSGYVYSGVSRVDGRYIVPGIQPGNYEIEVTLSGFTNQARRGLTFNVGAKVTLDFILVPATLEEEITVIAAAPIVEITKSEVSSIVTSKELEDLPLLSRNFVSLSIIKPGVQATGTGGTRSNAMPRNTGEYLIDGVSNEEVLENNVIVSIPVDAIQEFRVLTNQFAAEYGNAAGMVLSAITKSGSNEFRGRIYGFYRDEAFDAVNYFIERESYQGDERTQEEIDDLKSDYTDYRYGGFLGGPLIKNKLHFFLSYEYHYYKSFITIGAQTPEIETQTVPQDEKQPMLLFKLNYQLNEKNNFSFRFNYYKQLRENVMGVIDNPDVAYTRDYKAHVGHFNWTFYPSNRTMNELRIQYAKYVRDTGHDVDTTMVTISRPSIRYQGKYPNWPQTFDEPRYQIVDNFSLFLKDHTVKVGFDYSYIDLFVHAEIYTAGMYIFFNDLSHAPENPMTYPILRIFNTGETRWDWPLTNFGVFIQDSWKVNSRLTFNYGLRYNWFHQEYLNIDNGNIANNLNPRFAFSWDPVGDGKTVIRGGIGTFTLNTEVNHAVTILYGGTLFYEYWPGYPDPDVPNPFSVLLPQIFAHYLEPPTEFERLDIKNAYTLQTTLGFQREIFTNLAVGIDLIWAKGIDFYRYEDQNPIIPGTGYLRPDMTRGAVWKMTNNASTDYKALYLSFNKRFSNGWGMDIAYTLSKSMADTEGPSAYPDSYDPDYWDHQRWGPTTTDARHRVVISGVAELPFGFQLSGIFNYYSKIPWTPLYATDINLDGSNTDYLDSQYNSRRGFDFYQLNTRISNYIRIDRFVIQLFVEFFNLTNRNNFGSIFNREGNPLFGIPLIAGNPRLIQLGIRLNF